MSQTSRTPPALDASAHVFGVYGHISPLEITMVSLSLPFGKLRVQKREQSNRLDKGNNEFPQNK